jgi:exopolysaccharide production protein ExoZ
MFFYALFALSLGVPRRFRLGALAVTLGSLVVIGKVCGPFHGAVVSFYTAPFLLEFVAGMLLAHDWLRNDRRRGLPVSIFLIVFGFACLGSEQSRLIIMSGAFLIVAGCLSPRIVALQNRPLLAIGNASYSVYLSHQFVLEGLAAAWTRAFPLVTWTSSVLFVAAALALCAAAGWLCYRFIEKPLTSQLRKLVRGSDPATTAKPLASTSTVTARSSVRFQ